jgi:hypothetical protein
MKQRTPRNRHWRTIIVALLVVLTAYLRCSPAGESETEHDIIDTLGSSLEVETVELQAEPEPERGEIGYESREEILDITNDLDAYELISPNCPNDKTTLAIALCDPSFTTCEALETLAPAYFRNETGIRASLSCDPSLAIEMELRVESDRAEVEALSVRCDDTGFCELVVEPSSIDHLENLVVHAQASWGLEDAEQLSATYVLPVYACSLDPDQAFCLRYGEWEDRGVPFDLPLLMPPPTMTNMNDHVAIGDDGRIGYLRSYTVYVEGEERQAMVYAVLEDDEWSERHFVGGKPNMEVFDEMLLYEAMRSLQITEEGFELFIAGGKFGQGSEPILVSAVNDALSIAPVMDLQTLAECGIPYLFPVSRSSRRASHASVEFTTVSGVRHILFTGTGAFDGGDNIIHLSDTGGEWACEGLVYEGFDQLLPLCDGPHDYSELVSGGDTGLALAEAVDGSLHIAAGGRGGYVLYAHDLLPLDGDLVLAPVPPIDGEETDHCMKDRSRVTMMVSSDGGVHVFIEQENSLATPPLTDPIPGDSYSETRVLRYLRFRNGAVEIDEDLTPLVARLEKSEPLQGVFSGEGTPAWGHHATTLDACGRLHGIFGLQKFFPNNPSGMETQTYPVGGFTNLHGAWKVEAAPNLGELMWDSVPKLFRTPDGTLHLFAYLNTTWSGTDLGDRLHHFARPCVEVLAN